MAPLVHFQILIKKLDTITHEEFHQYWQFEHPKIWLSIAIQKDKLVKYSQFHVDHKVTEQLKASGLPFADYDGGVDVWGRSVEDLMALFQDEDYLRLVVPDEEKFLKRAEAVMMIGRDEELWAEGKTVD